MRAKQGEADGSGAMQKQLDMSTETLLWVTTGLSRVDGIKVSVPKAASTR